MLKSLLFGAEGGAAGIQYMGLAATSASCLRAIRKVVQSGEAVERALILTARGHHAFLLTMEQDGPVAIKSGFASGYPGEGPRTFADALCLLQQVNIEIDECEVSETLLERLDASALTVKDIETLDATPLLRPMRWHDYVYAVRGGRAVRVSELSELPEVMPWAVIDPRITDLALRFFESQDDCIHTGFRRLEDLVREKSGLGEHGVKLMQQAFLRDEPALVWNVKDAGEQKGRAQLFVGAFMAYRNPRAHRERSANGVGALTEFLMLNQLFLLEQASVRAQTPDE